MAIEGTVVNGVLVFDGPPPPDGTRLRLELTDDDDQWDELSKVPPPPATETYAEHLAALRQSIAAMEAGEKGRPAAEVFDEIDRELNQPTNGGG